MSTYVISDIHGEYEAFSEMLELINFSEKDVMYVLGDMVDRGPKPLKVIEHVMAAPNMFALKGNHEDMLYDIINNYGMTGSIANGMSQGTVSYTTYKKLRKLWYKDRYAAAKIISYIQNLPYDFTIEVEGIKYLLVHAGIKPEGLKSTGKADKLWIREEFYNYRHRFPGIVIFGHTPTEFLHGKNTIYYDKDKIGIDCGACFSGGQLGCLRLDDFQEFYV